MKTLVVYFSLEGNTASCSEKRTIRNGQSYEKEMLKPTCLL